MSLIITAILIIGGLAAAVAFVVGVIAVIGLVAVDVSSWGKGDAGATRASTANQVSEDAERRIFMERGFARAFIIAGGLFWGIAVFAGLYSFRESGMAAAFLGAFVPFSAALATLILGWYYERFTAVLLAAASAAVIAWGVTYQFEVGVWILVTLFLIGPMATAAALLWLARRDQVALELSLQAMPELARVRAES